MELIRENPAAYYELTQDIDMSRQTGVAGNGFFPIEEFSGHFDGNNHVIRNITLNKNNKQAGLFSALKDATVKNLQIDNVKFYDFDCMNIGTLAGTATNSIIDNCHVSNVKVSTNIKKNVIGGLVGQATNHTAISNCSFSGEIHTPNMSYIAGISAKSMTGTTITNCYSEGEIIGLQNIGGITSSARTDVVVANCYSTMNITGSTIIGGILGMGNGLFSNNYATGNIVCDYREGQKWFTKGGGIAAEITPAMQGVSKIENCVALNPMVTMGESYARVGYNESANASQGESELLNNNYALGTMLIGTDKENAKALNNDDPSVGANCMNGASVNATQLTQSFYEEMGWKFGKDSINPWVMSEGNPHLWFEFRVRNIEFVKDEITIFKGNKEQLETVIYPEKAENKNLRFESDNMHVAIVSKSGEITARNEGTANIKVITEDGSHTAICKVTVIIPVEKVEISQHEVELYVREGVQLEAFVSPDEATNKTIFWKSLNIAVAETSGGFIVGMQPGETQIVAIAEGGNATDTCKVKVYARVEDMFLNETSISLDKAHPTFQLKATIKPLEAANTPLIWSSEDEHVATVDQNGLVSAQRQGETIVSATTPDAKRHADCLVIVTENVGIDSHALQATCIYTTEDAIVVKAEAEISQVQLFNTLGQMIYQQEVEGHDASIATGSYAEGAYLIKIIYNEGQSSTHKVVL